MVLLVTCSTVTRKMRAVHNQRSGLMVARSGKKKVDPWESGPKRQLRAQIERQSAGGQNGPGRVVWPSRTMITYHSGKKIPVDYREPFLVLESEYALHTKLPEDIAIQLSFNIKHNILTLEAKSM